MVAMLGPASAFTVMCYSHALDPFLGIHHKHSADIIQSFRLLSAWALSIMSLVEPINCPRTEVK